MHPGEYVAVMQPNEVWQLFRLDENREFVFLSWHDWAMTTLLAKTRNVPLTLVGFN